MYEESPVKSLGKEGVREREAQRLASEKCSPHQRMLEKQGTGDRNQEKDGDITTEPRDYEKIRGYANIFENLNVMDG